MTREGTGNAQPIADPHPLVQLTGRVLLFIFGFLMLLTTVVFLFSISETQKQTTETSSMPGTTSIKTTRDARQRGQTSTTVTKKAEPGKTTITLTSATPARSSETVAIGLASIAAIAIAAGTYRLRSLKLGPTGAEGEFDPAQTAAESAAEKAIEQRLTKTQAKTAVRIAHARARNASRREIPAIVKSAIEQAKLIE